STLPSRSATLAKSCAFLAPGSGALETRSTIFAQPNANPEKLRGCNGVKLPVERKKQTGRKDNCSAAGTGIKAVAQSRLEGGTAPRAASRTQTRPGAFP